ncbi:MAG: NfeD family protein [Candidatus Latescibacterota bacterium]|jgi:membrane protein implicated in regulation of membrane protease activity
MENYWWAWMILAALFIVGEIFTAGFFLLPIGIGAALAGLVALLGGNTIWQLVVFVVASFILFLISRRFAQKVTKEQPPGIGADRFIGQECVVLETINNLEDSGRVRMGKEEWRAESEGDDVLEAGTKVTVARLSGTHLVVRPVEQGE